jgi:hypothetical protein
MAGLSISRAWDETRSVLAHEGRLIWTVALALLVLPGAILGVVIPDAVTGTAALTGAIALPMLLVALIGLIGRLAIARLALGGTVSVGQAIQEAVRRVPVAVAAFLLVMIPIAAALTPFVPALLNAPQSPSPVAAWGSMIVLLLGFALGVRLLATVIPQVAAQGGGPVRLVKDSWRQTEGHWWKLIGFVLLFFVAAIVATRSLQWVVGGAVLVALGPIKAMSLGALVLAVVLTLVGSLFTTIFTVMLVRIYLQLSCNTPLASVPSSRD